MSDELKREAKKQYFRYFRIWFIAAGLLAAALLTVGVLRSMKGGVPRTNNAAPAERVYDYGDMLTDQEEEKLRQYISRKEEELGIDLVLVTMKRAVEGTEAKEKYGYRSTGWTQNMQDIADDFWDQNQYGYNKGFEGDGALLLDNRYPGQRGEHLSTSGRVEYRFSVRDVEKVLNAVDRYYDSNPYKAYKAYIDTVCRLMGGGFRIPSWYWLAALMVSAIAACIYGASHLHQEKAQDTTAANDYVPDGKPKMRRKEDQFIRKSTVTRRIETSSGSGSGGSSGGGGHHHSSSGASHGGGSHRH